MYRLKTPAKTTVYYVVAPDARESDLTACSSEERDRVHGAIGVRYEDDRGKIVHAWNTARSDRTCGCICFWD